MSGMRFEVVLPQEVIAEFGWAEDKVPARVREVLVMDLLRRHAVSQRKAAELLQLNLWDLFEAMGQYRVPTIDLTLEELRHELNNGLELGGLNRVLSVDRFLDSRCQSRLSSAWWDSMFKASASRRTPQLRPMEFSITV
jgi:predicted HTH domain antitoxin